MGKAKEIFRPSKELTEMVDKVGKLRAKMKELSGEEANLTEVIKSTLPAGTVVLGKDFSAELKLVPTSSLDLKKCRKLMNDKQFMEVVSITKKAAETVLTKQQIDACSVPGEDQKRLEISPLG